MIIKNKDRQVLFKENRHRHNPRKSVPIYILLNLITSIVLVATVFFSFFSLSSLSGSPPFYLHSPCVY